MALLITFNVFTHLKTKDLAYPEIKDPNQHYEVRIIEQRASFP